MDPESLKMTTDFFLYLGRYNIPHELVICQSHVCSWQRSIRVNKSLNTAHYMCVHENGRSTCTCIVFVAEIHLYVHVAIPVGEHLLASS